MANKALSRVISRLRTLAALKQANQCQDRDLLARFVQENDEVAFTALVERHGPMVLRVCLRVLQHQQDAEDACQATFLILVRKAARIRKLNSLASWLHGVAFRIASKLRARIARSRRALADLQQSPAPPEAGFTLSELESALDEELERLPEKFRAPLVLCCLQGKTRDEAARHLSCTVSTLKGRLEWGRKLLQQRLARRGLALSTALLVTAVAQPAAGAIPASLAVTVVKNAMAFAAGKSIAGLVSAPVAYLVRGFLRGVLVKQLGLGVAACFLAGLVTTGGWLAYQAVTTPSPGAGRSETTSLPLAKTSQTSPRHIGSSLDERVIPPLQNQPPATKENPLLLQGAYIANHVAKCGDCHTPRNDVGELDVSRHLQGSNVRLNLNKSSRESDDKAPDITASGRAGKWSDDRMVKFLTQGEKEHDHQAVHRLPFADAQAVAAYLQSLPGKQP